MHFICGLDDIKEGQSRAFRVEGLAIFGIKKAGELFFYKNSCPHLGTELEWEEDQFLNPNGDLIQCSTHGALFTIESGLCISGPCQGANLESISIRIENRQIFLQAGI